MTPLEKVQATWPLAVIRDVIWIAPLGTRMAEFELILNRRTGECMTGWISGRACFKGTLVELRQAVEKDYGPKVARGEDKPARLYREYIQAIEFLEALPALEVASGVPESGLGPADMGEPTI